MLCGITSQNALLLPSAISGRRITSSTAWSVQLVASLNIAYDLRHYTTLASPVTLSAASNNNLLTFQAKYAPIYKHLNTPFCSSPDTLYALRLFPALACHLNFLSTLPKFVATWLTITHKCLRVLSLILTHNSP